MRSFRKSMLALMLCAALIIGLLPVHAASLREVDLPLSKGLEYTRVFLPDVSEQVLPHKKAQ